MPGSAYRWLLVAPLLRGSLLSLAVAGFCVGCLFLTPAASPSAPAPLLAVAVTDAAPVVDQGAEWPRTVLRLWFLVPQLLPPGDR